MGDLPGVADILGILEGGRFLAIEMKAKGKKPTEAQIEFIDNINQRGGVAFWADGLDSLKEQMNVHGRNHDDDSRSAG